MMMFRVLFTVFSVVSIHAAQASQVSQVEISGSAASQVIQMMDQKFEPIYEQQPYQTTCNREVLDHMQTSCSTVNDTVCHGTEGTVCTTENDQVCNSQGCTTIPRKVCHQDHRVCEVIARRECRDYAVMRTEYYGCTQYRTVIVGQRLVKTFQHNVEVSVDHPELLADQKLVISLLAREASVYPTLVSSFALNMLTVEQQISNSDHGSSAMISTRILVHVGASTALMGKILSSSVQELALSSSGISMKIAGLAELSQELTIGVHLSQHRAVISDKTLFKGSLASSNLSTVDGDSLSVIIPLSKMNIDQLKDKRHNLSISVSLKRPALSILNANDLAGVLNKRLEASLSDVVPN